MTCWQFNFFPIQLTSISCHKICTIYSAIKFLPTGHTWRSFTKFLLNSLPKPVSDNYKQRFCQALRFWSKKGRGIDDNIIEELKQNNIPFKLNGFTPHGSKTKQRVVIQKFPDELDWRYEEETLLRIACGYQWRWSSDGLDYLCTEHEFRLKLRNPETGYVTPSFDLAGKIDGIVKLPDGRLAVKESKLYGEAIEPEADMWRRMRLDHQVTLYVLAARELGYDVDCVLYDVARKPTIKPNAVPVLDELGVKIVVDQFGNRVRNENQKTWRQTASTEKGWTVQTRPMDVIEWGNKLTADIVERPAFYFSRVEIPRLENDLAEFQVELWDIQRTIRDAQANDRWYRTATKNTCPWCEYFDLCSTGWKVGDALPEKFRQSESANPELKGESRK